MPFPASLPLSDSNRSAAFSGIFLRNMGRARVVIAGRRRLASLIGILPCDLCSARSPEQRPLTPPDRCRRRTRARRWRPQPACKLEQSPLLRWRLLHPLIALHARDVDAVIALDPGRRTELAQKIWRAAERAGGDVQPSGATVEAAGRSERRKRVQLGDHRFPDIPPSRIWRPSPVRYPCPRLCRYRFGRKAVAGSQSRRVPLVAQRGDQYRQFDASQGGGLPWAWPRSWPAWRSAKAVIAC
jgi:hypothetical protein